MSFSFRKPCTRTIAALHSYWNLRPVQVRAWGLAALAAAYRNIACEAAKRMLALADDKELLSLLSAGAER